MRRFIRRETDEEKVYCIVQSKQKVILISLELINAKQHSKVFHNFVILASLNRYKLLIVEFKFALVTISNQTRAWRSDLWPEDALTGSCSVSGERQGARAE